MTGSRTEEFPRPGPIGRVIRGALGLLLLNLVWVIVLAGAGAVENPMIWLYAALSVSLLAYVVNLGFGVNWGRRLQLVVVALGVVAVAWSSLAFETVLAPPLWWWLKLSMVYVYVHLGVSFILAGLLATPGCEMRAIPQLLGRIHGREVAPHHCLVFIHKIDQWEARRR